MGNSTEEIVSFCKYLLQTRSLGRTESTFARYDSENHCIQRCELSFPYLGSPTPNSFKISSSSESSNMSWHLPTPITLTSGTVLNVGSLVLNGVTLGTSWTVNIK